MAINLQEEKNKNTEFGGNEGINLPSGTTRATGQVGELRYNTDLGITEQYTANGWIPFELPPLVTNQTGIINQNTNSTISVLGANFRTGATVYITGPAVNNIDRALTTTFVSAGELSVLTNAGAVSYLPGQSYGIKVENSDGRTGLLSPAGNIDQDPVWVTASGSLGTYVAGFYANIEIEASDADGDIIAYTVAGGSLPPGMTINRSTGLINGVPDNVTSSTTYSPVIRATTNSQTVDRTFNITIVPIPGVTSVNPYEIADGGSFTLTGTNLGSVTAVTIGGQPCSSISASATQVTGTWNDAIADDRTEGEALDLELTSNGVTTLYPGKFRLGAALFGSGADGNATTSGTLNTYTYLNSSSISSGTTSIAVGSSSGFSTGDAILIHQTQDYNRSGANIGNWEFNEITNVSGNTLTLKNGTVHTYYSGTYNANSSIVTQVIRVPQYNNLTLNGAVNSPTYNGTTGGIVALKVKGIMNFNGNRIENGNSDLTSGTRYTGKGFRGGTCNGCSNAAWGDVGEGWKGYNSQSQVTNNGDNGGGGSYGPSGYGGAPSAGGGNGGRGGRSRFDNGPGGQNPITGTEGLSIFRGNTFTNCVNYMVFGGGAGGGGDNDGQTPFAQDVSGGGVVIIVAAEIQGCNIENDGSAGIMANNSTGYDYNTNTVSGGKTGGGAGGSILIVTDNLNTGSSGTIRARGGYGAWYSGYPHYSGAGGGGRIAILAPDFASGTPGSVALNSGGTFSIYYDSRDNSGIGDAQGETGIYYFGDVSETSNYAGIR